VAGTDLLSGLDPHFVSTSGAAFMEPQPISRIDRPGVGQAVRDPEFETVIRRITDSDEAGAGRYGIRTMYTGTPAWNLHETALIAYSPGVGHRLYLGGMTLAADGPLAGEPDYRYLGRIPFDGINSPTDVERVYWSVDAEDPLAPVTLYFPNQEHELIRMVLPSRYYGTELRFEVVHDFAEQCEAFGYSYQLLTESHHWTSSDGRTWGFKCGPNPGAQLFGYDLAADAVLWQHTHPGREQRGIVGTPMPSPSGRYFVSRTDAGMAVLDRTGKRVGSIDLPQEHFSMTMTPQGKDVFVTTVFDEPRALSGSVVACTLPEGECGVIVGRANGFPYPPSGTHHSGLSYWNPGWTATSIIGFPPLDGRSLLNQELLLSDLRDLSRVRVGRIGHHRSARGENPLIDNHYWQEPHPVLSPTGCRVAFSSDWSAGRGSASYPRLDVYVVELPCFQPLRPDRE
jgi:hypothetical protein